MATYAHNQIVDRIRQIDLPPSDPAAFAEWITAPKHLQLLRDNAQSDEVIVYASGEYTFIYAAVVPNEILAAASEESLFDWHDDPFSSIASFVYGGGRSDVWVERKGDDDHRQLSRVKSLVFARDFEGWNGPGKRYFEINQEFTHVTGIHWRPEHHAYCRYDENGDLEEAVSITGYTDGDGAVRCVSFAWPPLERYLAATNSALIRRFDFTLLHRGQFPGWPDGPESRLRESDLFFYHQKVIPGVAAYTAGRQIITPRRPTEAIFADIRGGRATKQYAEFITLDWRNGRVAKISVAPGATTNYFEAHNNQLAFEVSPAFFKPEVILKYKGDKDKYTIRDRDITCRNAWTLRGYDVNAAGQVFAYLCYLRDLPYREQLHWQSFNEPPKAGISERARINDFEGQFTTFTEPLQEVLSILRSWQERRVAWWDLRDERLMDRVSTPLTTSRDEWADAFLELAKLVVEGFKVRAIRAQCDELHIHYDEKDQSITLLERLLSARESGGDRTALTALRTVQEVRTKVKSHAAGEGADEIMSKTLADHGSFTKHFKSTCAALALELQRVAGAFF